MDLSTELIEDCIENENYDSILSHLSNVNHPVINTLREYTTKNYKGEIAEVLYIEHIPIREKTLIKLVEIMRYNKKQALMARTVLFLFGMFAILFAMHGIYLLIFNEDISGIPQICVGSVGSWPLYFLYTYRKEPDFL